jgi:1-acyl-sn-glycerol-3-phosphate acyltransferase
MAEQPAAPEAVSDPAQDRIPVLGGIALALAAWPLLALGAWLCIRVVGHLPAAAAQGDWPLPLALVLGLAVSWRRLRTTVPGLIGWLLGAALLAVVRIAIPDQAGLPGLLILQGPLTITLVMAECARSRRCRQGDPPMARARAVMWGLAGGYLLLCLYSMQWSYIQRQNIGDESFVLVLAKLTAPTFVVLMLMWWLPKQLMRALLPRTGKLSADGHTVLNSLFGYGTFVACCLSLPLLLPVAVLSGLISRHARLRLLAAAMRRGMTLVLFSAPTVRWSYAGELAALNTARVVVANHEGMLDILAVCALPGTRTLLAKTWVFRAFPLGLAARAASLRNSDALEAEDYTADAAATSAADAAAGILVFPEGRRSRSGLVERFRPGAFVLAATLGSPVVPVAISGSRQGIRPDGMWIHPTILHCQVLPPMARGSGESHRQFAERCRARISAARLAVLCAQLANPRMAANRLQHYTGLGGRIGAAVRAEHRAGAWRVLADAVADLPGPWLLLGCGWSTLAVSLRQLLPGTAIIAVDADAEHRAAASCAWFAPATDQLCARPGEVVLPARLAGLVCLPGADQAEVQALAERALAVLDGVLVVPRVDEGSWRARAARPLPPSVPGPGDGAAEAGALRALRWPGG